MDKRSFKKLLQQLLDIELELLRKRFRPYKRRPFLRNKVKINIGKSTDNKVAGYYINTKESERQIKYIHNIFIAESYMESYGYWLMWHMKRFGISQLRQVIRHELIHAFVFEEWEEFEEIKNTHGDYSPIFLSCLYWGSGNSHHPYVYKFSETELGKEIRNCITYDDLQLKLMRYIMDFEKSVSTINKNIGPLKEIKIIFNDRGAGITKKVYFKTDFNILNKSEKAHQIIEIMTLGLGFLVTPKTLIDNYKRKFDNGAMAMLHKETIAYVTTANHKKEITVFSNIKNIQ